MRNKIKYLLLIVLVSLVFIIESCNSGGNNLSQRERNLFVQSYHGFVIPIDSFNTLNDFLIYLDDTYCLKKEKLWPVVYIDMKTKKLVSKPNKNTIKIGIEPTPCINAQIQYDPTMILEIVKDGHNTHIEGEFTEIDSIPNYVKKQMLSFGKDPNYAVGALNNGIWICTNKDDKFQNLYPYIYQSVIGFLKSAREYSQMAYKKSIDKLTDKEYQEFAKEFVFHLSFKYTDEEASIKLGY